MKTPLLFALVGTLCGVSHAQPVDNGAPIVKDAPQTAPVQQPEVEAFSVRVKNVRPSVIAYWLDPKNHENPLPTVPQASVTTDQDKHEGALSLPKGVLRIVAVDPQNVLLVFGTREGVDALANTIRFLDRPLRQVEVEARFFRVASDQIENLKPIAPALNQSQMSRVTGNIDGMLALLLAQKKATLLSAPRITAVNNLGAELNYSYKFPVTWGVAVTPPVGDLKLSDQDALKKLPLGTALNVINSQLLKVTPTINNDDTVTLLVKGDQKLELQSDQKTDGAILLKRLQTPELIINMRDGETVAFEEQSPGEQTGTPNTRTLVLLTARIVRKTGD